MRMPLADPPAVDDVIYPESDDQPMAENFLQSIVIRTLVAGFERLYAGRTDIIVGGVIQPCVISRATASSQYSGLPFCTAAQVL